MSKIFVINRRLLVYISVIVLIATVIFGVNYTTLRTNYVDKKLFTVVIDAGHGGIDNGVMGKTSGVKESELNLLFAEQLKKDFISAGFRVVMTRTTSAGLYGTAHKSLKKTDMQNRRKIIENANPDIVISLHMNYYALSSRRGAQVFYNKDGVGCADFASCIQKQINGMEEAVRSCSALVGDYYILNVSPCPAVLVECGFLSNEEDEKLLVDKKYREKLSYTLFKGCVEYLSLSGAFEEKSHLSHNN